MPVLYTYRLFVSHAWEYSDPYRRFIEFLDAAPNFSYANHSVPQVRGYGPMTTEKLREQIREQIRGVNVVVVLAGMYVAHSDWIQFEIDYAKLLAKPILGIEPWGAVRIPEAVTSAASLMVGWNTSTIVNAIRQISK